MEIFRFYYWLYRNRLPGLLRSHRLYTWLFYLLGWLLVLSVLWWWGQYFAVHGLGSYSPQQSIWLFLEISLLIAPILVWAGAFLYTYQTFLTTPAGIYTLATPGDHWRRRLAFLFLVLVPLLPMVLVAFPAWVGTWRSGASFDVLSSQVLLVVGCGILAALFGVLWSLCLQYGVYRSGVHAAFRVQSVRILVILSLLVVGLSVWGWVQYSFFLAPPFGPVGSASDFGAGTLVIVLAWFSGTQLTGYGPIGLFLTIVAMSYLTYRLFSYFWRHRYEWAVPFRESNIRASRRIGTRIWLPVSNRSLLSALQLELLSWLRDTPRILWVLVFWIVWLLTLVVLGFGTRSMPDGHWFNSEGVVFMIMAFISGAILVLLAIRCIVPYLVPNTPGGYFLRTVPIMQEYVLRAQILLASMIMLLSTATLIGFIALTNIFSLTWIGGLGLLYLTLAVLLPLGAIIVRLRTDYHGSTDMYSVLAHIYGQWFLVYATGVCALFVIVMFLAVTLSWWWLLPTIALSSLATVSYIYSQTEYSYRPKVSL